nr:transketolase C-terminal domain-containing protein [Synergistales bacterium]
VLRAPDGLINQAAAQHSQSLEAWFMHVPGLKVVIPSNPADAKGLLKSAIRDDNPVIFFEHKALFRMSGPVPKEEYLTPIGKAKVVKEGKDVTLVSYSLCFNTCLKAAELLDSEGISVECIDLRTISPIDKNTILESVAKTSRLAIAHEAVKQGGVGAEISAIVAEEAIDYLDAPIVRVGAPFTPVPFAKPLEQAYRITPEKVADAIRKMF